MRTNEAIIINETKLNTTKNDHVMLVRICASSEILFVRFFMKIKIIIFITSKLD